MLPSRMDRNVSKYYEDVKPKMVIHNNDILSVNDDKLPYVEDYNESHFRYFLFVPLIAYNYSGEKIMCHINPRIYGGYISGTIYKFMEDSVNTSSLKKKKVELDLEHVPYKIYHKYNSHIVFLNIYTIFFATQWKKQLISNRQDSLVVKYSIKDSLNKIIKTERINIALAPSFSLKSSEQNKDRFIYNHMTGHDYRMKAVCDKLTAKIINDLKN
ncbi:MAG: hypothetical protein K0S32_2306 [Bacteroidetes bacterium]|jgi:hypothetical protein|nr:hypothetical protein [Bacteroidota bacterium]